MRLREAGIITRLQQFYRMSRTFEDQRKNVEAIKGISLEHLFGPFGILLAGILLSLIVLIFEIIHYKAI